MLKAKIKAEADYLRRDCINKNVSVCFDLELKKDEIRQLQAGKIKGIKWDRYFNKRKATKMFYITVLQK